MNASTLFRSLACVGFVVLPDASDSSCVPNRIRTGVLSVKSSCPGPLDDGDKDMSDGVTGGTRTLDLQGHNLAF